MIGRHRVCVYIYIYIVEISSQDEMASSSVISLDD